MKKRFFMVVATVMVCAAMAVGCGMNKAGSDSKAAKENATEITEAVDSETKSVLETEEAYVPVGEEVAAMHGVSLESNQGIVTAQDGEAIVVNLLDGYKFLNQYSKNSITMEKMDYSESYSVFDATGTLTKEVMKEEVEVEDCGNGCFIQADRSGRAIKAFWFGSDAKAVILYTNNTENPIDFETVSANIASIMEGFEVCK